MKLIGALTLLLALLAAPLSHGSHSLPDAPSAVAAQPSSTPAAQPENELRQLPLAQPRPEPRGADAAFWTMIALSSAATVADVETTVAALRNPQCREANPIFGSRPTRARLYGIMGGVQFGLGWLTHWRKKQGHSSWWVMQLGLIGTHTGAAVWNARTGCF